MWFIGVDLEQETSAPPPKKNPGSAPVDLTHFGLASGMVFERTTGVYKRTYHFNSKREKKKEKSANLKWILRNHFCWCSDLGKEDMIS